MKPSTKENLQIAAIALGSVPIAFGLIILLDWLGLDGLKWFGAVLWTAAIFGIPVSVHPEDFRKVRCRLVFSAALAIHLAVLTVYLRGVSNFPNRFFFYFSLPELAVILTALYFLGGAGRGHSRGR